MKKKHLNILTCWLPLLVIASIIFTASSQSYGSQDLKPFLNTLFSNESGFSLVKIDYRFLISIIMLVLVLVLFIGLNSSRFFKKISKSNRIILITCMVLTSLVIIFLITVGSNNFYMDYIRGLLSYIRFSYASYDISIESMGVEGLIDFILRKSAHFGLFLLLGLYSILALTRSRLKACSFIISFVFVIIYAILDELHQRFVPSRTPLVEDIIIDILGGLIGIMIGYYNKTIKKILMKSCKILSRCSNQ
ncbi:VanZ family protein [Metabacillus halosaccharovorans]|uniref:VanZ family protein n=1 Tax=Metabacillus halosaccharovorans TaxID=930124 RepID=UPI0034CF6740